MDPTTVNAAAQYLAAISNQQPEALQGTAELMLMTGGLNWRGGTSFEVADSLATLRVCPTLVSDDLLGRAIADGAMSHSDRSAARIELERRLLADPIIASRTESRGTNAPGVTSLDEWTKQRAPFGNALSVENLLGSTHFGNLGTHGRQFDPNGGGEAA